MAQVTKLDVATAPAPGKRELNKAEKKRRILGAARELFQTKGFEETTTAEIAERAGIGAGTLYLYVGSKPELLVAVYRDEVDQDWGDAFDRCDRSRPLLEQLLQIFGDMSAYHAQDPKLSRSCFKELTFLAGNEQSEMAGFIRKYHNRLTTLLADAQDAGQLRSDVPANALARNLFALWYHLMRYRFTDRLTDAEVEPSLRNSFGVALLGLVPSS